MLRPRNAQAFSLLELVVAISILSILAAVAVPHLTQHLASARDARRLQDVKNVKQALDQYFLDHQSYPSVGTSGPGGWDVSSDGDFIPELVRSGYLGSVPMDPLNDGSHAYYYYVYPKGSYGCASEAAFYVLAVKSFETADCAAKNAGWFQCSGRNWNDEFAYVTGGGASFQ